MGLKYRLTADQNRLALDIEAYWRIESLMYNTEEMAFQLVAYPNRECALREGQAVPQSATPYGAPLSPVEGMLHVWRAEFPIATVFPGGIPLSPDEQKTSIYNFVKSYTGLPFTDVFEEEATVDEPLPQTEELG